MDDKRWFKKHLRELRAKHEGKLVAVLDGKIVLVGDDLQRMARKIDKQMKAGKLRKAPFVGRAGKDIAAVHIPHVYIKQ